MKLPKNHRKTARAFLLVIATLFTIATAILIFILHSLIIACGWNWFIVPLFSANPLPFTSPLLFGFTLFLHTLRAMLTAFSSDPSHGFLTLNPALTSQFHVAPFTTFAAILVRLYSIFIASLFALGVMALFTIS